MNVTSGKKIALIIASQDYQPIEYTVTKHELEAVGIKVITASDRAGGAVATDKSTAIVDITIDQLHVKDFDGIFLIGGSGAMKFLDNSTIYHLLAQCKHENIPYGAICIASRILAKAGVLTGKKATGWDEDLTLEVIYKLNGVTYEKGKNIVTDGLVVTADGPKSAKEFAQGIMRVLTKKELKPR